jgi:hypothetical protein
MSGDTKLGRRAKEKESQVGMNRVWLICRFLRLLVNYEQCPF